MRLQQATAFRPFPRELTPFATIAMDTCQYKVPYIVSGDISTGNTAQGECVLYMIGVSPLPILLNSWEFGMTTRSIIAAIFLAFQLLFNLSRRIRALNSLFASNAIQGRRSQRQSPFWRMLVAKIVSLNCFFMRLIVLSTLPRTLFYRVGPPSIHSLFAITFLTRGLQAVNSVTSIEKILFCAREKLFTHNTLFIPCWNGLSLSWFIRKWLSSVSFTTFSTLISQSIFCLIISPKKFRCSRLGLKALSTSLVSWWCWFIGRWFVSSSSSTRLAYSIQPIIISLHPLEEIRCGRFGLLTDTTCPCFWKSQFRAIISCLLILMVTNLTKRSYPTKRTSIGIEVLGSCGKNLLTTWASFVALRWWRRTFRDVLRSMQFFLTLFARLHRAIVGIVEVGQGLVLLALCTAFHYNVSHDGNSPSLSSRHRVLAHRDGDNILLHQLYHKTAQQASLWYFCCLNLSNWTRVFFT